MTPDENIPKAELKGNTNRPDWFKHDVDASSDEKILHLRAAGGWAFVGLWWSLVELLSRQDDYALKAKSFPGTAVFFSISLDELNSFINACLEAELLTKENEKIYSVSLRNRLQQHDEISRKRSEAASKRYSVKEEPIKVEQKQCKSNAIAEQLQSNCSASLLSSLILSNKILSKILDPSFANGGGVKHIQLNEISAEQVLSGWLSAGLDKSDFIAGLRAYDAWKGKKAQAGQRVPHDDACALLQPWVMTEAIKLKNEMERLRRTRGEQKKIDWDAVFDRKL